MEDLLDVKKALLERVSASAEPREVLKATELKQLYARLAELPKEEKRDFGQAVNQVKLEVVAAIERKETELEDSSVQAIDVTAPMDINSELPSHLPAEFGSIHPLSQEIEKISQIFGRMGYVVEDSREIDDQFHMFESLNFPKDHPARDDYDTFMTEQKDGDGSPLIAPAHTSTMQYRTLVKYKHELEAGGSIAAVVPDRVFRNEDLDARHEHTFYQVEGIYVAEGVHAGMLIATLQEFLESYYNKKLQIRVNPFYFPFTEPSFEFALSCPFCDGQGCQVCSHEGWIELLGCGMIHPNVLKHAGIDSQKYSGFAFGCGIDRLVMMKTQVEDVRHFQSAKLEFLRQF